MSHSYFHAQPGAAVPTADGRFRGIAVPAIPWCQVFAPGDHVRHVTTGRIGTVLRHANDTVIVRRDDQAMLLCPPGELRPLTRQEHLDDLTRQSEELEGGYR